MAIVVTQAAQNDEVEALDFELTRSAQRAALFVAELESIYERLELFPESASILTQDIRRAVLVSTGYSVFYRTDGKDIFILRILHGRMNPDNWPL